MKLIENDFCELKSILTKDLKKEIIAFANTNGGKIYIGIDDNGKVIGVKDIDNDLQAITGMINEGIKPSLIEYAQIKVEELDGKNLIIIDIQSAPNKPYYLAEKGLKPSGVYLRHGASCIQASDEIIKKLIFEHSGLTFEEMLSKDQKLTFNYLKQKFKENNLIFDKSKYKILNILNKENKYTNLGLLLSDQCPYSIKCAIFSGLNKIEFRDRKEFTGSILKQVDDIFKYFEIFNKTSGKIIGLKRIDTRDYPEFSLREALLNAVIHRSYYYNSSVMVKIYDDRFEITSMGGLIDGITIDDIFKGISLSRNPNLSNIFYRFGYVESYGTGIGRIMDSYNEFDKKPVFDATENTFSIILPNMNYKEVIDNYVNDNNIIFHSLSQEDMIVQFLKKYNKINRNETEKLLNVSKTRAYKILDAMIDNNIINKEDNGKNTYYILK